MEDKPPKRKRKPKPKDLEEFVVKASLNGSLHGNLKEKKKLMELFKGWSDALSQRLCFASRALTLILKECFSQGNLQTAPIPNFLEQTFIRQLMLGLEGTKKENDPYLKSFFETYPQMLRKTPRYQGDRNIYSSATTSYLTNLKVSLSYIFEKRLLKLVYSTKKEMEWKEKECIRIVKHRILGDFLPKDIEEMNLEAKYPTLVAFIQEVRSFLDLKDGENVKEGWLKANPYKVIRFYAYILSKLTPQDKTFNLLPLTNIRNHFVTLDKSSLLGLFKQAKLLKTEAKENNLTNEYLESVFKLPKKKKTNEHRGITFTGTIQTDGTSICFHYRRPKKTITNEARLENLEAIKKEFASNKVRKLACDPGRDCIYTIIEEGSSEVWKLSRREYYSTSGIYHARGNTKEWTKPLLPTLDTYSKVTSKGLCLEAYKQYLETFLATFDTLWLEYSKKRWANQRLRMHGGKKRCMDRFWNKVLEDRDEQGNKKARQTIIAYGGAKMAPGGKGEMNVPTSSAFKACQKRRDLKVLVVDEFRTSKLHHQTHQLLYKVNVQEAKQPLRGLLWCCSTISNKQGFFVNRDVNAAWNILKVALERPEIFQRKKDQRRLPKQQTKMISCKPRTHVIKYTKSLGDCKRAVKHTQMKASEGAMP